MPAAPKGAKWTEPPKIVTRLNFRSDRIGYTDEGYKQHLRDLRGRWTAAADHRRRLEPFPGPAFSPDGRWIAFSSLRVRDAEHVFRQSRIYAANVETGEIRELTHHPGTNANPVYSPDGRKIAFIAADSTDHSAWAEEGSSGSWTRMARTLMCWWTLGDRPVSGAAVGNTRWIGRVFQRVESDGSKNLYFASSLGVVRPVTTGVQVLTVTDVAANGLAVGVRSTPLLPNDVVAFTLPKGAAQATALTQLTMVNEDVIAGKSLAQTEQVWYTSKDGLKIQGWIVKPAGFDPTHKYPLILDIHGGPQSMYNVGFSYPRQYQAAQGYVVLYTNPRGSTGYGAKFTNEIKNAYPGKDFDDLMAGVDTVIGRGYVDTKNLFVYGCSGGGVLTAWTVGHTDRFAGAAVLCPVIDWMSFVGETDGAGWYGNFEKPFWEDPSEYLKRSPIMYVGNVKTPTMLMTGVLDLRTPMPQSEEFYRALKLRGVPTMMVRMNNEYHGTLEHARPDPAHAIVRSRLVREIRIESDGPGDRRNGSVIG